MTLPATLAACRGHDPMLWFPERFKPETNPTARAVAICQGCAIRAPCLDYALSLDPPVIGIWGGRWLGNGKTGRISVTPAQRAACRQMAREGVNQADIARALALSFTRVAIALQSRSDDVP